MIFVLFTNDYNGTNNDSEKQVMVFNNAVNFNNGIQAIEYFKKYLSSFWEVDEETITEDKRDFLDILDYIENEVDIAYVTDNIIEITFLRCDKMYAIIGGVI